MKSFYACVVCSLLLLTQSLKAQLQQSITVNGDADKYYPVTFNDANWFTGMPTEIDISRPLAHVNANDRGTVMASFSIHLTNWGHASSFVDAKVRQTYSYSGGQAPPFIAGWFDASNGNGQLPFIVWLRGGGTTYILNFNNASVVPTAFDNNAVPFVTTNGATYGYKTTIDSYVLNNGVYSSGSLTMDGTERNYLRGKLGLGTTEPINSLSFSNVDISEGPIGISWFNHPTAYLDYSIHRTAGPWSGPNYQQLRMSWLTGIILDPGSGYGKSYVEVKGDGMRVTSGNVTIGGLVNPENYKLAVAGTIGAQKVKVTQNGWADFVFAPEYRLPRLYEIEQYIKAHGHLQDIPSETEVAADGIDLGEMNKKLLQKVEELTLHMIEQNKEIQQLKDRLKAVETK